MKKKNMEILEELDSLIENNYDKLLVLYEKQQKEIELLKESNKSFKQQYNQQVLENAKIVNFYENDDLHKELYKLRKEIEELKKYEQYYKEQNEVNAKFVPKSKIQERIYELENFTLLTVAQRNEVSYAIGVLKELLEEE